MKTYGFSITLKNIPEINDSIADALFEAGCDDGSPGSCDGVTSVWFDREAETIETAIQSAIRDVRSAGFEIESVKSDEYDIISKINQTIATAS